MGHVSCPFGGGGGHGVPVGGGGQWGMSLVLSAVVEDMVFQSVAAAAAAA